MIDINAYILEKLHISKNMKSSSEYEKYIPTEEDYDEVKGLFNDGEYLSTKEAGMKRLSMSAISLLRKWTALMNITNSRAFVENGKIYSLPGNFGSGLVHKVINVCDFPPEDIIDIYEANFDEDKYEECPKEIIETYNSKIDSLLSPLKSNIDKVEIIFDYTKNEKNEFIKMVETYFTNMYQVIKFKVYSNGKTAECSFGFSANKYYNYFVDDKKYPWSNDFLNALAEKLNLK